MTLPHDLSAQLHDELLAGFAAIDEGRASQSLDQVTADFRVINGDRHIARHEYSGMLKAREAAPYVTRHIVQNVRMTAAEPGAWRVHYVVTVYRRYENHASPQVEVVDFSDIWLRDDANTSWRLRERHATSFLHLRGELMPASAHS